MDLRYETMRFAYIDRHNFDNAASAAASAALRLAAELSHAVQERGRATLAVALSADALPLLRRLAEADIPWNFITIVLADECYVPLADARSREAALRAALYRARAREARFVGLYNAARTTELAAFSASARVDRLSRPLDCLVLDMDEHGQTAGLFKGSSRLKDALAGTSRALVLSNYVRTLAETHLTMTLPLLAAARLIVLPLSGKSKLAALETVLDLNIAEEMPIRAVLRASKAPAQIFWSAE